MTDLNVRIRQIVDHINDLEKQIDVLTARIESHEASVRKQLSDVVKTVIELYKI
jgi:peptidoglycan hydrolase CwlO-like protein